MIDLGESTPFVECKLKSKTYRVYANDANIEQINKLVAFYQEYLAKVDKLDKRFDASQDSNSGVKPISKAEFISIGNDLLNEVKDTICRMFDDLLQETGVGKQIWGAKEGSTEYAIFAMGEVQEQLRAEQKKYEHRKAEALKKAYPVRQAKAKSAQHRNSYRK